MCFSKKRKAKKIAEKQAKAALEQKKADELKAKNQEIIIKEEPIKTEPKAEPVKVTPPKPAPTVAKEKKQVAPVKKEVKVEKKVVAPVQENAKKDAKPAKYHVSQNKDPKSDKHRDWRVRREGSEKTIKYFSTQKEAIEYADSLASTAGSSVVIHKLDGSIRKQAYTKKA